MYKILNQLMEFGPVGVETTKQINPNQIEIFRITDSDDTTELTSDSESTDCGCNGDEESTDCSCVVDPVEDIVSKFRDFITQQIHPDDSDDEFNDDEFNDDEFNDDEFNDDGIASVENEEELDSVVNYEENPDDLTNEENPDDIANEENPDDIANEENPDDIDHPNRQGTIRTVKGAHLVYKRKTPDGFYEELWMYNIGKDTNRDEIELRKDILSGTDIPPESTRSPDGDQSYDLWTVGNGQMLKVMGLPN